MSTSTDYPERLNLAEQVARIERMNVETAKFVAEQQKLAAEASKLERERTFISFVPVAALAGAVAALTTLALRALGAGG